MVKVDFKHRKSMSALSTTMLSCLSSKQGWKSHVTTLTRLGEHQVQRQGKKNQEVLSLDWYTEFEIWVVCNNVLLTSYKNLVNGCKDTVHRRGPCWVVRQRSLGFSPMIDHVLCLRRGWNRHTVANGDTWMELECEGMWAGKSQFLGEILASTLFQGLTVDLGVTGIPRSHS